LEQRCRLAKAGPMSGSKQHYDVQKMEVFRSVDVRNRGFLTSADFRRVCLDLDVGLTAAQIAAMFAQLDADHDGRITGDDFVRGHRAFTELFIDRVTSVEPPDVTPTTPDSDGSSAYESFVERYAVELFTLTSVRYRPTFY